MPGINFPAAPGCNTCGCGCNPSTTQVCVHFTGCNGTAQAGVSVTIKDPGGTVIGSGTSAANGNFCVGVTQNGAYTADYSMTGYVSGSVNITIAGCSSATRSVNLTLSAGYTCCFGCPTPTTIHLTDANTTIALNSYTDPGTGDLSYCGGYQYSGTVANIADCSGACSTTTGSVAVWYVLDCVTDTLAVLFSASACDPPGGGSCVSAYASAMLAGGSGSRCSFTAPSPCITSSWEGVTGCTISVSLSGHSTGTTCPLNLIVNLTSGGLTCFFTCLPFLTSPGGNSVTLTP